ncbi:MAG TPA: M36 family metallopeptidase [Rugosimonospora sp.]|nr:M36 family metallopeptidase [Rugosimonospora sp.]
MALSSQRGTTRRLLAIGVASGLALTALSAGAGPASAKDPEPQQTSPLTLGDKTAYYDSRQDPNSAKVLRTRAARMTAQPKSGVTALRRELGSQGIVSLDPLTSTARSVSRLDGFLTGPSRRSAATIALNYVTAHPDVFGLDATGVSRLSLRRDYVDIAGTHHLSFIQAVSGVPVFGNGIQANVTKDGQLVNVVGSPVSSLPAAAAAPGISAADARVASIQSVEQTAKPATATNKGGARRTTVFSNGDQADLAYFMTAGGLRLAWQTLTSPNSRDMYTSMVDAVSGKVLYRRSLVNADKGPAWDYYPGAPNGGTRTIRDLTGPGWLPNDSPRLAGNVAHVYTDVNDDNVAEPSEEITPTGKRSFAYPFTSFNATDGGNCSAKFVCTWDPKTTFSWQTNRGQNAVQVFYYLGKYHDHLRDAPIGFTRAAGNFEAVDGDAVQAEALDGANTANGFPDANHADNANMATPPDGTPPRMQMYLFPDPANAADPFLPTNGGDEADVVYHEYTHGLSNRLVVDALGNSTLGNIQAGSMGEAWSDWYAMDFLVDLGFQKDTKAPGEVRIGNYVGAGKDLIRTQPMDCPVGTTSTACPGAGTAGPGGYTYGDFGHISTRGPEVHADGEIWGETLWDLRTALGSKLTESLVTRAMELSPANPSYLDMRNSILMADQIVNKGKANKTIWKTFAARGMGWFAGSVDGDDINPVEDFTLPPAAGTPTGSLTGVVTDQDAGTPVAGAVVGFGGHASGFPGDYAAVSDANGRYTITGIVPGTYPAIFARGDGFDRQTATLSIASRVNTRNWSIRRDWAAVAGGGTVTAFNGPDFTPFGCGPGAAIDQSLGNGWGSTTDFVGSTATPKFVTVKLPRAVNLTQIAIDPGNTCGDAGSASTGAYRLETSTDGTTFTVAAQGTFGAADRHRLNSVPLAAGSTAGVRFFRFTMLGTQLPGDPATLCPGPFSGCQFMDMSEIEVYGAPA